ncbi:MAG: YjbQ family protein [Pedobacter sp.]|nr:MAG: YjbQ family protein [Pedobacter sp.]
MQFFQKSIQLRARSRGFHLVTDEILEAIQEITQLKIGMLQVFIQHTSASLTINENADPTVRLDFETWANKAVPEGDPDYQHDYEGDDQLPSSWIIPISSSIAFTVLTFFFTTSCPR